MRENLKVIKGKEDVNLDGKKGLITKSFIEASRRISPLWDVRDYVAVNPFFGFKDKSFLEVAKYIRHASGTDIIPKRDFFLKKYESGEVTNYDLEVAKNLYDKEVNHLSKIQVSIEELVEFIKLPGTEKLELKFRSISDLYDIEKQEKTTELITNEVSKWSSAYFDEGQALWRVNNNGVRLYSWWRSLAKFDKPFREKNKRFSNLVDSLPHEPSHALQILTEKLLKRVSLDQNELTNYYYRLIYTILGWSSFIQKFEFESSRSGNKTRLQEVGGLIDIVVIRMAYDISLLNDISDEALIKTGSLLDCDDKFLDYASIWLKAAENSYRDKIEKSIKSSKELSNQSSPPDVQIAFCIDVRSEILRRQLENLSEKIQTIGFAGFFGMPISLKGLGHSGSDQNCPVLLNSAYEINEIELIKDGPLAKKKKKFANFQYFRKSIQSSANSGFSFVETFGFGYIGKIIAAGLGGSKPNIDISSMGLSPDEKKLISLESDNLDMDHKVKLAYGALKNMGLISNFAKYVFFFGHGSESSNNPYASGLDCGACAGHNGQANAMLLVNFLNDNEVREKLKNKGIEIPKETLFLSGWHNTVKDEILVNSAAKLSDQQQLELGKYYKIFDEASKNCKKERATKLPSCIDLKDDELTKELSLKANEWSEIRPEWGLARNASFIVGRRQLTRKVNLDGRSFLHDYDHKHDQDFSTLELIMTAPMIVTNWINMQYYVSTVEPSKFGAGNKVLNNVVGGIGCIQGNESDLLGGLTEQSVWYKGDYFHEPIRLQVFIEAKTLAIEKIIKKHEMVSDLVKNDWLDIISIDPENKVFKLYYGESWIETKECL